MCPATTYLRDELIDCFENEERAIISSEENQLEFMQITVF